MTVSVPCRSRLLEIAWALCLRGLLPQTACPVCDALGRVAKQDACGRWPYARAVPWVKESVGHPAEKGRVPAPSRPPLGGVHPTPCVRARGVL